MITLELLQEFSDVYFENYENRRVSSYKLYKADGFTFIHIVFEGSWVNFVRLDVYYEWFNGRRDSKLVSIGI
jgi:hypothetical protein